MMKKLLLLLTVAIAMLAAASRSCRQNEMDESQLRF